MGDRDENEIPSYIRGMTKENSNLKVETQKPQEIKEPSQKKKVPVKQEPPCFNFSGEDHGWRQCQTKWVKFCHNCGKHNQVKQTCDSTHCRGNL